MFDWKITVLGRDGHIKLLKTCEIVTDIKMSQTKKERARKKY